MTLRSPPWDSLNLRDDYVETRLQANWSGPRVLFKDWNNMITSFKDSWNMMGFLFSSPNIEDDLNWEVVKPLGKGGFGQVGLWQAREKVNGDVVDEIAIKQARRPHHTYDADSSKPGFAKEAWWQNQINQNGCDDILYLRRYKFYQNDNLYRLYMEYCPYGDLDRLRYRYRAYGKYLPELFLWHLFSALASAIRAMEEGPFIDPANDKILPVDSYMLHMDLKPSNVFLGYTPEENDQSIDPTLTSRYPSIKVSDFGLADVTGEKDDTNVKDFWDRGTTHFHPPEQRLFGHEWRRPPNYGPFFRTQLNPEIAKLEAESAFFQFNSKHNVWLVGKIMYDMITLSEPNEYDDSVDLITEAEYFHLEYGISYCPEIGTRRNPEYSAELLDLVSECLRIDRKFRPEIEDLVTHIGDGKEKYRGNVETDLKHRGADIGDDDEALYFRRNDVNKLRDTGDEHGFSYIPADWQRVVLSRYQGPDWTTVNPKSAFRNAAKDRNDYVERERFWFPSLPGYVEFRSDEPQARTFQALPAQNPPVLVPGPVPASTPAPSGQGLSSGAPAFGVSSDGGPDNKLDDSSSNSASGSNTPGVTAPTAAPGSVAQPPPPPTLADYQRMRVPELHAELRARAIPRHQWGKLKRELVARLRRADRAGNRGNGAPRAAGPLRR